MMYMELCHLELKPTRMWLPYTVTTLHRFDCNTVHTGLLPCSVVDELLVKFPLGGRHAERLEDMVSHILQELLIGHLLQHSTNQCPPVSCIVELCT